MDKLNLSPQERRLVAGVGLIVFVFLNIWLVWPHFSDWRKIQADRDKAERTLDRYRKEVERLGLYQSRVRELENQGSNVEAEEQDVDLATMVQAQSQAHQVEITSNSEFRSGSTQTNQFFDEKARKISYRAGTEELVNFLTSLTTTNSLIRVKDMSVRPDPPNAPIRLSGEITLVASYQRKPPAKAATVVAAPAGPSSAPIRKTNALTRPGAAATAATNKPAATPGTSSAIPKPRSIPSLPKS